MADHRKGGFPAEIALRSIEEQAPVGLALVDTRFRFVRINRVLAEINGPPREEQIGRRVAEVIPDVWPAIEPHYRRVLERGEVVSVEITGETPAEPGVEHTWSATYYPVTAADETIGLGAIVVDITEQREAEAIARRRARKQAAVAELGSLALAVDVADLGELHQRAADLVANTLGIEFTGVGELLGQTEELVVRAVHGWDAQEVRGRTMSGSGDGHVTLALRQGDAVVVDDFRTEDRFTVDPIIERHGVRSGIALPVLTEDAIWGALVAHSTVPGRFTANDVEFLRTVANILSAAARRAAAARQSLMYETVLERMSEGVALMRADSEGRDASYVYVNGAYARMLGYAPNELLQKGAASTLREPRAVGPAVSAAIDESGVWTGEVDRVTKTGGDRRHLVSMTVADHPEFGPLRIEVATDVTEARGLERLRARLEEQRRRLLAQLVRAQENERRRIAGDIHDDSLQTLSAIKLRLELLRKDVPEHRDAIARIEQDVRTAATSLRELLFELRPPSLIDAGLAAGVTDLLDEVERRGGPTAQLTGHVARDLPLEVRTICYRIAREAILNAELHSGTDLIEVRMAEIDNQVVIQVIDRGIGFDPEAEADTRHLGLITMRERAELAGGSWHLTSAPGAGTTVEFRIPVESAPADP
jgi:PAS domain S-box-containing protein